MSDNSAFTTRIYALLFVSQFFGFPLASTVPVFAGVDSKPISVAYRALIGFLTVIFLCRAVRERWSLLRGPFVVAALVLALLLLGRIVWDATLVPLPLDLPWSDDWKYLFGVTIVPMLAFVAVPNHEGFEVARKLGAWVGSLTLVLVLAAVVSTLRGAASSGRLSTDILNPISLAQMAVSCVIVINARAIAGISAQSRRFPSFFGRWLMTILGIMTVIASVSKGPILGLFLVTMVAMLVGGRTDRSALGVVTRLFWLVFAMALVIGILLLVDAYTPFPVVSRFMNAGSDTSTSTRLDLIQGALAQFEESPFIGSSVVEYSSRFYPHNIIVEVLMTNGVIGLAALGMLLFGCVYCAGRILWYFPKERWIALLFIQYFSGSMFSGSLYFDATTWATMLVVLGCAQAQPVPAKGELDPRAGDSPMLPNPRANS